MKTLMLVLFMALPARAEDVPVLQIEAGTERLDIGAGEIVSVSVTGPLLLPAIEVVLAPEMTAPVAALTGTHVGEELVIRVCGAELMRPTLRDPISGGRFMLTAKDGDEAHRIAGQLRSKNCLN